MNQKDKIRSVVILLEGFDLNQNSQEKPDFPSLNKVIAEGNSTLIIDENQISKTNPLISVLSFAKTFSEGVDANVKVQEDSLRIFEGPKIIKENKGGDDEEIIEVKYISHPKKLSEITDASVVVVTDSEKAAKFCELSEINYFYQKNGYSIEEARKKIERPVDLLILHREATESKRIEVLNWIEDFVNKASFDYDLLRIIFSPFGESLSKEKLLERHREQNSSSEDVQNALKSIVPVQTWQYYRGKVTLNEVKQIENVMLMITNRKELNRADTIKSISDYTLEDNIGKFGGKVIHSFGVLREILFELGKLPKFGA